MASHRRRPSRPQHLPALLAAVTVAATALVGAAPAAAEPSVAEIERQIDVAWNRLEPVIERHNLTRQQLAARRKKAADLTRRIAPLQRRIDVAMGRVGDFAARQYKGGNASTATAFLRGGSPSTLAERLQVLDRYAKSQQAEVRGVVRLKEQYLAQKAPLDRLIADLAKTDAQLAARAKQIDAEITKLEALRLQAYGSGGSTGSLRPAPCPVAYPGGDAGAAIKFACAQIGKPYRWGAEGPGAYDCSGLTSAAWAKGDVSLPHNAAAQRRAVPSVKRSQLRPGDLVFYYGDVHHVALYAGRHDGTDWIVHASRAGQPVAMRKMDNGDIHSYGRPG
ncbi:MAG TPA: NlpC/P60 family protein [Pilimelia sp.]|nr:NlpC/P60 family protein [Pilimelia sp.]